MAVTDRASFTEYCLRRLGKGAHDLEITDEQASDRVDDALELWMERHSDATYEIYAKHQVTDDDKTNRWIPLPNDIYRVSGLLRIRNDISSMNLFNVRYQMHLNDVFDLSFSGSLSNYVMARQYINLLDDILNGDPPFYHSFHEKRLYVDHDWESTVTGSYLVMLVTKLAEQSKIWNDRWLKAYATALLKRQWGENLLKYNGIVMLGGTTFNGSQIFDSANTDITKLEEDLLKYEKPMGFFMA